MHIWSYESIFNTFSQLLPDLKMSQYHVVRGATPAITTGLWATSFTKTTSIAVINQLYGVIYTKYLDNIVELILYKKRFQTFSPGILILYIESIFLQDDFIPVNSHTGTCIRIAVLKKIRCGDQEFVKEPQSKQLSINDMSRCLYIINTIYYKFITEYVTYI